MVKYNFLYSFPFLVYITNWWQRRNEFLWNLEPRVLWRINIYGILLLQIYCKRIYVFVNPCIACVTSSSIRRVYTIRERNCTGFLESIPRLTLVILSPIITSFLTWLLSPDYKLHLPEDRKVLRYLTIRYSDTSTQKFSLLFLK